MTDLLVLDLVENSLMTDQIVLTVGYDIENLKDPKRASAYKGEVTSDYYGRQVPKHAHGSVNLKSYSSSTEDILKAVMSLYDSIIDPELLVRRIYVTANHVINEKDVKNNTAYEQLDLFTDYELLKEKEKNKEERLKKEKNMQHALIDIKNKFGKNAVLKGSNFVDGAMTRERNSQIGGHKA
jgi:DNA polymerase V